MKIQIKKEGCVGHARCWAVSPEIYNLDDDGYIAMDGVIEIPPGKEDMARRGARACPERIITIVEE